MIDKPYRHASPFRAWNRRPPEDAARHSALAAAGLRNQRSLGCPMPRSTELLRDIHEINLMYLLLLQRLARDADASALAGVPLSREACLWLAALQPEALVKQAQNSVLLAQLNLAPHLILAALSQGIDTTLSARAATELPDAKPAQAPLGQI